MDKIKKYQRIVLLILLVLTIIWLLPVLSKLTVEEILTYTPKHPFMAAAVLLALYSLKALVCAIPMTVLYISAGIMFPPAWAIAVTYAGLICEITIGYWVGRYMVSEQVMAFRAEMRCRVQGVGRGLGCRGCCAVSESAVIYLIQAGAWMPLLVSGIIYGQRQERDLFLG